MRNKKGLLLIIALLLPTIAYTLVASKTTEVSFSAILPAVILLFITFSIHYRDYKGSKKYQFIHILILVVDLVLIIYNSINRNLPFTGVDWANYDYFANNALASSESVFDIFGNSIDLFTACIAMIYRFFGTNITVIFFYILPLSFVLSHYLHKTVFLVTADKKRSMLMSTIILLMPANFIFSLSVLREIPIQCVSIISLYFFLTYTIGDKKHGLFRALLFAIFATLMHSGMIAILIVYLYVLIQKKLFKKVRMLRISTFVFAGLFMLAMSLPIFSSLTKRFDTSGGIEGIVTSVNTQNSHLLDASTNYINGKAANTIELFLTLPYRVFMFTIAPLPWQINSLGTLVAFFADAIFRYYIVFKVLKAMFSLARYSDRNREVVETTFMVIALFDLIFCLGTTNYGQAMRHRTKILSFELVLISTPQLTGQREGVKK